MLSVYAASETSLKKVASADLAALPENAVWIDLVKPTSAEDHAVERLAGIAVPTREDMQEIEISSRLYIENGARYMTATLMCAADTQTPRTTAVTFILASHRLVTVRYDEPKPFMLVENKLARACAPGITGEMVLMELLDAVIDRNADMMCCPVDYTNSPHIIMQNDHMISINNTTQIDLQGQAASESDGHRHISGTGGQPQFVRGTYASKGGKSFICLASTYERKTVRKSRIVLNLTQGNIVTTPRSDTMYVVTEYGMVNLKGKSVAERARALIAIAHPDFREELERDAYAHGLIPRGVTFN